MSTSQAASAAHTNGANIGLMHIRPATTDDFDTILALNHESVAFLSPLDVERLAMLHGQAAWHRVVEDDDGRVIAFLLALREGAAYDSVNYGWFARHYPRFLYVDRVVVARASKARGAASRLYRELFRFAAANQLPSVVCEVDIEPPNPDSLRFHQRFGFSEVGRQWVAGNTKQVALQVAPVGHSQGD